MNVTPLCRRCRRYRSAVGGAGWHIRSWAIALATLVVGCSESARSPGVTEAGADRGIPIDAPSMPDAWLDAGERDTAPILDAGTSDAQASTHTGFVTVHSNRADTRVVATFLVGGPAYRCTEETFGACKFLSCAPRVPRDPVPAPHAGLLDIANASRPVQLSRKADGTYDICLANAPLWSGGSTLLVLSAAGGAISQFQGHVVAPAEITFSAPAPPQVGQALGVSRASGLDLAWMAGTDAARTPRRLTLARPNTVDPGWHASSLDRPDVFAKGYEPRRPEETVLYEIVRGNLDAFLLHARDNYDKPLPGYVKNELARHLACRILAKGLAHCHCDTCGHDGLVAFSCKGRGIFPSCATRWMSHSAAHWRPSRRRRSHG